MTMCTAYYDASGSESVSDKALIVCGLVADVGSWTRLERNWDDMCDDHKVTHIHMHDLAHFRRNSVYPALEGKESKRRALLDDAVRYMRWLRGKAFLYRMVPDHWHEVNDGYDLAGHQTPTPFTFLAAQVINRVNKWYLQRPQHERILHLMERGDAGQEAFAQLEADHPDKFQLQSKRDPDTQKWFRPFETTDILGYEHRNRVQDVLDRSDNPIRGLYAALERQISIDARYYSQRELYAMCRAKPDLFPRRKKQLSASSVSSPSPSEP